MKMTIRIAMLAAALFCPTLAHAWPQCSGNWNQVPAGTSSAGGAIYTADGLTWQCQPKTTPPTPSTPGATSASTSNANSTANSSSNSASNATGGNSSSVATGGNQKQQQSQSSNSSVSGSGNSTNSNTSTSSASNNGNGSNDSSYSSTTNVAATKVPVATAVAPAVLPTNPCFKGVGVGVQTMAFGGSFGGGKIDSNCAILEAARTAPSLLARCKVYISNKYVKQAGVTLEDCLVQPEPVPTQVNDVVPTQVQPVVVNVQPAAPVVIPAPVVNVIAPAPAVGVIVHAAPQKHRRPPCSSLPPCPVKPAVWDNEKLENLPYSHGL